MFGQAIIVAKGGGPNLRNGLGILRVVHSPILINTPSPFWST